MSIWSFCVAFLNRRHHIFPLVKAYCLYQSQDETAGKVEEFEASREEWSQYVKRHGHFIRENGTGSEDRRIRSVVLAAIGPATYKYTKPGDKSYEELVCD